MDVGAAAEPVATQAVAGPLDLIMTAAMLIALLAQVVGTPILLAAAAPTAICPTATAPTATQVEAS